MRKNSTAVILVNYKDYANKYLTECYTSLSQQTNQLFDIFIADNSTSNESVRTIKKLAPRAMIVCNKENLGWAGGNNSIIKTHLAEYDYFVILNMDTVLEKDWLAELISAVERSKYQIVQSKVLIHDNGNINSLGNRINYLGYGYCNAFGLPGDTKYDTEKWPIDYASGASMIVKREVFEKIGFFREEFFMYHDDLEFSWRARLAGYKVGLAEESICHHKYSFGSTMNHIYYMERNRLITLFSLEKARTILLMLPMLIPFEIAMILYMAFTGNLSKKIRSLYYLFTPTGIGLIHKIRKEVKGYRALRDREVVKSFAGKVIFAEIKNPVLNLIANPVLNLYWILIRPFVG
jgi:hypothetical protein